MWPSLYGVYVCAAKILPLFLIPQDRCHSWESQSTPKASQHHPSLIPYFSAAFLWLCSSEGTPLGY